ncbi:unnamed protein product [Closterium sp. NIES-65]|nr:unnamed protein product [Closterium sp. NIES-65]
MRGGPRGIARLGSTGGSRRLVCRSALLEDESDGESTRISPALKKAVPGAKPGEQQELAGDHRRQGITSAEESSARSQARVAAGAGRRPPRQLQLPLTFLPIPPTSTPPSPLSSPALPQHQRLTSTEESSARRQARGVAGAGRRPPRLLLPLIFLSGAPPSIHPPSPARIPPCSAREAAAKRAVPGAKPGSSKSWQETTASAAAVAALLDSAAGATAIGSSGAEKATTAFASSAAATGGSATAGAAGGAATGGASAAGPAAAAVGEFCIIEGPDALQDFARMQLTEIRDNITSRRNRIFLLLEEVRQRVTGPRRTNGAGLGAVVGEFCIVEGPDALQDFARMQLTDIRDNITSRRNRIFLLLEEIRRLRIQQEIKNAEESRNRAAAAAARAKLGGLPVEEEEEMPEYPSSIPFLPPLKTDTLKEYYITFAFLVASLIIFGGLVAPTLQLRLGMGGTSYEDFIASMHLPRQLSGTSYEDFIASMHLPRQLRQVDPIVAFLTGGGVGVLSPLSFPNAPFTPPNIPSLLSTVSSHGVSTTHPRQVDPIVASFTKGAVGWTCLASFTKGAVGVLSALLFLNTCRLPFPSSHYIYPSHASQVDSIVASFTGRAPSGSHRCLLHRAGGGGAVSAAAGGGGDGPSTGGPCLLRSHSLLCPPCCSQVDPIGASFTGRAVGVLQVDPIVASFTGRAVGVLSALLVVEVPHCSLSQVDPIAASFTREAGVGAVGTAGGGGDASAAVNGASFFPLIPPPPNLPSHYSQVDPIVASFTGGAVGVLSALLVVEVNNVKQQEHKRCMYCHGSVSSRVNVGVLSALLVVEVNNVKQQEHKRCMYCHGSGYLACARCAATGSLIDVQLEGEGSARGAANGALAAAAEGAGAEGAVTAGRQGMKVAKRCPNCAGLRKVRRGVGIGMRGMCMHGVGEMDVWAFV